MPRKNSAMAVGSLWVSTAPTKGLPAHQNTPATLKTRLRPKHAAQPSRRLPMPSHCHCAESGIGFAVRCSPPTSKRRTHQRPRQGLYGRGGDLAPRSCNSRHPRWTTPFQRWTTFTRPRSTLMPPRLNPTVSCLAHADVADLLAGQQARKRTTPRSSSRSG